MNGFGIENLPYGVFSFGDEAPRVGIRLGDAILDVSAVAPEPYSRALAQPVLNAFLALGPSAWRDVRAHMQDLVAGAGAEQHLVPLETATLHLPFAVADYVDFYASEHHATNLGRILRPGQEPLMPNWRHLPVGYHGRSGTVVVSGTPIVRPVGQVKGPGDEAPRVAPTAKLDFEAELGFVVGVGSRLGAPVTVKAFRDHVFGVSLVNDWSARDIQAWEYVPLGPFLGKSFATSISPWITPLDALEHVRMIPPHRDPLPPEYLDDTGEGWGLDIGFEVKLNGHVVSRPPFAGMYWTPAQMLAHMTRNGASLRTGDLFASGTVSGPSLDQRGSMIELSWGGAEPLLLPDGSQRSFLEDGDEVVIAATAGEISLGEVRGRVLPSSD